MKTGPRISKPVLVLATAAVALSLLLIWVRLGHRDQQQHDADSAPVPEAVSIPAVSSTNSAPVIQSAVRTEGELPPVIPISLAGVLADAENKVWNTDPSWLRLPRGTQSFGGIEFHIEGVVQLQGEGSLKADDKYRTRVLVPLAETNIVEGKSQVIERGAKVGSAHLVSASRYSGDNGVKLADVIWRYADGTSRRSPLSYAVHLRDWRRMPYEAPVFLPDPNSKVVWRKANPSEAGRSYRLYRVTLANPEPAKILRHLEFASAMSNPSLVLLGLTLDPLKPGERPDGTPNLEETDPPLDGRLQLLVQNTDGQPVANAKVRAQCFARNANNKPPGFTKSYATDANGLAEIGYVSQEIERLEISASHEDYGGRKMIWDTKAGDSIPATYTIKLSGGISIGGTIVDERDNAISEAKISLNRFWMGGEAMNKRGEQADLPSQTKTSDALGRWEAKGLPAELLDHIGVGIKHADYMGTNFTVASNNDLEQQLRARTFKVVLHAGLEVRGRVTDDAGTPISEATVWAGGRYTHERQEQKTDAQGKFGFRGINEGDVQFSVTAQGRKPEIKTVSVKPGMEEIVFKLGRGQVLRALVQNEAAEPLPDTRVSLESPGGGVAESYEFNTTTDKDGRFEWDGAPDEAVSFYFYKAGYEQKRRQRLKPNEDNIVTLRKTRQVQGWVLDAETEKPISKFRVGVGRYQGADSFYADYPGLKDYADANGAFSLDLSEEESSGIKAEADDYAEQIQKLPEAQNGVVQVVLRLKPSAALRAVLVTPEGAPVPGATVGLTSGKPGPGMSVNVKNGRLTDYGRQSKIVTTDASGQFVLPSPPESGMVVAAAEMGFALAPIQQVRDSGRLVLQTFGQIEGTFKIGGQPVAGQEFMFSMMNAGISLDFGTYKATTDEAGRFSINKVPPGEGQIVRLVKTLPNSWMHSHNTPVVVEPGKTTQIALGDSGAVLKGHVSFETPLADDEKLTISGRLSTQMPERPSKFQTSDEARAFFESPEWKERMKQVKNFAVSVNADGSLTLDSIPPGTYTLNVTASKAGSRPFENPLVAEGRTTVTIPEGANPYSPINLGEITLKLSPQPNVRP